MQRIHFALMRRIARGGSCKTGPARVNFREERYQVQGSVCAMWSVCISDMQSQKATEILSERFLIFKCTIKYSILIVFTGQIYFTHFIIDIPWRRYVHLYTLFLSYFGNAQSRLRLKLDDIYIYLLILSENETVPSGFLIVPKILETHF